MGWHRPDLTLGENTVDVATWAGSTPPVSGIARVRIGPEPDGSTLLWLLPIGLAALIAGIAIARNYAPYPR